jgi:tRNA 2-thiocytidine biosynthesis protein TtcA
MLSDWEKLYPGRTESIFRAIRNVKPSQLADRELFDFRSLTIEVDTELHAPALATPAINVVNL